MWNEAAFRDELDWLGASEADALLAALDGEPVTSIRLNPQKILNPQFSILNSVKWCAAGRYLAERPSFTLDTAFHAGHYYVQEASSMFVEWLLRGSAESLDGVRLLDLCASPGGKTTLYSSLLGTSGIVVANEPIRSRVAPLVDNVRRWGVGNVVVTDCDPARFAELGEFFDVVAVDAPCSGEGMFRKDNSAREQWSTDLVAMCAARQRRILADAWQALRPGGVLIYSTCTFNRAENEENIKWLIRNYELGIRNLPTPPSGVVVTEVEGIPCFRFFPHRVQGEGFFACALRKGDGGKQKFKSRQQPLTTLSSKNSQFSTLNSQLKMPMVFAQFGDNYYALHEPVAEILPQLSPLHVLYSGVSMGQIFKGRLKPDHPLAMFYGLDADAVNIAQLSETEALNYLSLATVDPVPFAEGINLVAHSGALLGWANRIGGRVNNLYPKSMAIKKRPV